MVAQKMAKQTVIFFLLLNLFGCTHPCLSYCLSSYVAYGNVSDYISFLRKIGMTQLVLDS